MKPPLSTEQQHVYYAMIPREELERLHDELAAKDALIQQYKEFQERRDAVIEELQAELKELRRETELMCNIGKRTDGSR